MNEIVKAQWHSDGEQISLQMPFAKVNKEQRTVSGFATLDNVDTQGDVVTAEASRDAFARARGNIREMHQPIAVGRIVDFKEDEFYDPIDKKMYRGIFVTARVSKGAQDTWEKVLDGTLTGFSIGGSVIDATNEFSKDANQTVRTITKYDLTELSLVDNPANQLANVFSFQKNTTGSVLKGMVADTRIENVFWCHEDEIFKAADTEVHDCPACGKKMENIGWFETGENREEKVREVVSKFLSPDVADATEDKGEGGVDVPEEKSDEVVVEPVEEVTTDEPKDEEVVVPENPVVVTEEETTTDEPTEEVAKAETVDEVETDEDVFHKKIDELKDAVDSSLQKNREEISEVVAEKISEIEKKIGELDESFTKKVSELESQYAEFGTNLEAAKSRLADFEKKLDKVNDATAVRKSSDNEDEDTFEKSNDNGAFWKGAFSVSKNL